MKKTKKTFANLSIKEKSRERKKTKIALFLAENTVGPIDTIALPTKRLRNKQENFMRYAYKTFNEARTRVGLKPKEYKRINSKGKKEKIL